MHMILATTSGVAENTKKGIRDATGILYHNMEETVGYRLISIAGVMEAGEM